MAEKRTKPEIRFKGFEEAWEERELGAIVKLTMGQSPNGENYTDNPEDHILVQGNADMKNGKVVPRVWTKQITKSAEPGDLIMSIRAPVGDVGKTDYAVVVGRGVAAIQGNEFIFQYLKKMNDNGYWKQFSAGSTFDSINSNDLYKAVISTTTEEEQSQIGTFFQSLDALISLRQKKLDKLTQVKKSMLEKMFPKDGADEPEIRFKGFTGRWERKKLGAITTQHNSGVYIKKEKYGTGVNIIGVGNLYDSDIVDGTIYKLAPVENVEHILQENDLIYGESSLVPEGIAKTMYVDKSGAGTAFAWHTRRFKIDNSICNSHFLSLQLNYNEPVRKYLIKASTQTALTGMTTQGFFSTRIAYPSSLDEQKGISVFFQTLDNLITLQQRELEKLKNIKKSCLEKMFV